MIRKILAGVLSVMIFVSMVPAVLGETFPFVGFSTSDVNMRSGPGTSYSVTLLIRSGEPMIVNGESGTYYIVSYEGKQGYVAKEYLQSGAEDGTRVPEVYETLNTSSTGAKVSSLQAALKELGYYTSSLDGRYGAGTAAAVSAFQAANGHEATGIADADTQRTLYEMQVVSKSGKKVLVSVTAPIDEPYMAQGKKGSAVKALQERLKVLGYYTGKADADYGKGTAAAVKAFQKKNSLAETGEADSITLKAIYSDKAVPKDGATPAPGSTGTAEPTATPAPNKAVFPFTTTTKTSVNLRKGKGVTTTRILTIPKGASITVLALDGNYLQVKYSGRTGYVAAEYVNVPADYYQSDAPDTNEKYVRLIVGSKGSQVVALQNALKELGYYTLSCDGDFGERTRTAVKAFQKNNGILETGIADSALQTLLFEGNPRDVDGNRKGVNTLPDVDGVTLRLNSTGDAVTVLQMRLKALGFYTGDYTSTFDRATEQAVRNFQKVYGLTSDGVVGPKTQIKLNSFDLPMSTETPVPATPTPELPAPQSTPITVANVVTLSSGMRGTQVVSVERRLAELGYYSEEVNGIYDDEVIYAVKAFQAANGLTSDGIAGLKTQTLLFSEQAKPFATPTPEPIPTPKDLNKLQSGSTGDSVKALQSRLITLGYLTGEIDGVYGRATVSAVREFQKVNGLTSDGIAGFATLQLIYTSNALPKPTAAPTATPKVTATPKPTATPRPTATPKPTATVRPTATPVYLIVTPAPVPGAKATATPKLIVTATPRATATPYNAGKTVTATATPNTRTVLQRGDKGSAVQALQQRLSDLGYLKGWDGIFGSQTYSAVVAFQKRNSLSADGIAGPKTLTKLYSVSALSYVLAPTATPVPAKTATPAPAATPTQALIVTPPPASADGFRAPSLGQVINVNWYTSIRDKARNMPDVVIYDPDTGLHYNLHMFSLGKHADCEPPTAQDTAIMNQVCGINNWTAKAVWVIFSDGSVYLASTHSHGHEVDHTANNDLEGHVCLHFPRVMSEAEETGPYAVSHQNAILAEWSRIQALLH